MIDFALILKSIPELLHGTVMTLALSVAALVMGAIVALPIVAMRMAGGVILRPIAIGLITVLRGIPLLIQLYLVYYGLPQIGLVFNNYVVGLIVLGFYMGAYLSEILRGAIEAISFYQVEAAYSLGLSYWQMMRVVILPQAIRLTIPPSTNQFVTILKESSLVSQITIMELTLATTRIISFTFKPVELFMTAALFYLVMTMSFVWLSGWFEKRFTIPGLELKVSQ